MPRLPPAREDSTEPTVGQRQEPAVARLLLLDTSVWIDAVDDASELARLRRMGHPIAVTDEAVLELVAGTVSAAEHDDVVEYERRRAACGQAVAYATVATEPIQLHLARLIELYAGPTRDLRAILRKVAEARTLTAFRKCLRADADGSAPEDWPAYRDAQRSRWRKSSQAALASLGDTEARIDAREYEAMKAESLDEGNRALLRIEAAEVKAALDLADPPSDDYLVSRLLGHLRVYLELFREVCLDRYTGPHNENEKRVRFEEHDWNDIAQWRYLQGSSIWVTSDTRWPRLAKRTRFPDCIQRPSDVQG